MKTNLNCRWVWYLPLILCVLVAGCGGSASSVNQVSDQGQSASSQVGGGNSRFVLTEVPLVSNVAGVALHRDGNMTNAWGLEFGHTGRIWVNNADGLSTVYDGQGRQVMIDDGGKQVPLAVKVTAPRDPEGDIQVGLTGMVFNTDATAFKGDSFIFADESGTLAGWAEAMKNTSKGRVDNSGEGAVYKGLTLARAANGLQLYAADFSLDKVDVFDSNYRPVDTTGKFVDPTMPANYAPFNIKAIHGQLYVTYAEQSIDKNNDVGALGHGYIDVFSTDGAFEKRLVSGGVLNSPWGLALAPADFGALSNKLLIGNFRDGYIHVFDPESGKLLGQVMGKDGQPLQLDQLWSLTFGTDNGAGKHDQLFFSTGSSSEQSGVFGRLDLVQ